MCVCVCVVWYFFKLYVFYKTFSNYGFTFVGYAFYNSHHEDLTVEAIVIARATFCIVLMWVMFCCPIVNKLTDFHFLQGFIIIISNTSIDLTYLLKRATNIKTPLSPNYTVKALVFLRFSV